MSRPAPDPTRWFTDLINSQKALLTATAGGAEIPAAKQWTDALTSLAKGQMDSWNQLTAQWAAMFGMGLPSEPIKDRRFSGEAWTKDPRFEAVARAYLAQVDLLTHALEAAPLDERSKGQWSFALRQVTDALSPANNLMTNPEAQQLALETGGKSLTEGLKLFIEDLAKGRISMTDERAFRLAGTSPPAKARSYSRTQLIQLIQYSARTERFISGPLVIVPPCINKFYILDLRPENSFVRYAVEQGHTVFLVSWRNITPETGHLTWDDYLAEGVMPAIDVALAITGADRVNALGFCIGGTLLASALAVLAARASTRRRA